MPAPVGGGRLRRRLGEFRHPGPLRARVLAEPPAQIAVVELAESSVDIAVRPFVKYADYWNMQFDLREVIKLRFDEAGITIPFPQRVITLEQKSDF